MQQNAPQLWFATVRLASGPQVHYAAQGDPGGEPILFLHGYTDSWFSFSRLLPLLPHRYRALALDQRGHGDSERPDGRYTVDDFTADVVAFLEAVGVERATVVGRSAGSFIARRVAQIHPSRVSRLVLIGSAVTPLKQETRELQAAVHTLDDPVPAEFACEFQAANIYVPLPEAFFERAVAESLKLPARVWKGVLDGILAVDDAGDLGRITAPTLLIWGDRDGFFARDEVEALAVAIPGAQLLIYPETGHAVQWERPERVASDLDSFLRQQPAARSVG
jgi:pimeloyl-ACP methyl ester carboxylesterase